MTNQVKISIFDFKSNPVRIELFENEPYFCLTDICLALNISNANSSRFKFNETGVHKMYISFPSGKKEVTFINEPNLYRIIFRSNKTEAVEFQNWVFEEVLPQIRKTSKYSLEQKQLALPEPEKKYTFEFTEYELQELAWAWFAFKRGVATFQHIHKAFQMLGSNLSPQIYGQAYEYLSVLRSSNRILNRITKEFEVDPMTNWRVLKHLRQFDPKAVKMDF